ncbi:MAG: HU family DNA-binding protein [Planctomycetota bacterium]
MTKNDIVLQIAEKTNMRQTDVKQVVQMALDGIIDTLTENGRLELRNFGVFEVRQRRPRKARNPRTGEEVMVPACKIVTFKAGKRMEECISNGKIASSR